MIQGGNGDDILLGGGADDQLFGQGGFDILSGDQGADLLNGGADLDVATFEWSAGSIVASLVTNTATGDGSDVFVDIEHLVGSTGNDVLTGNGVFNFIHGLEGNDTIFGGGSGDNLFGWTGNDDIDGDDGDDFIDGQDGIDDLDGGLGTDSCLNGETNTNCEVTATTGAGAAETGGRPNGVAEYDAALPTSLPTRPAFFWELYR